MTICVSSPRVGEEGVFILLKSGTVHVPEDKSLSEMPIADKFTLKQGGGVHEVPKPHIARMSRVQRAFALNLWRQTPSATPKDIHRIFQQDAMDRGAPLREGRLGGYQGDPAHALRW